MAAAPGLPLCLLLLGLPWRVAGRLEPDTGRRFSTHKLCADEECSMLMYRAEALEDFTGPDCRFVNFKKGDHVHVYYKLAGTSPEVWAGTVGRIFGYFPKDLLQIVHKYTKEELQIPADETDFVCFDGGRDTFDNYNVEELLGFLDLHNSATRDSEKALEKTSQPVEEPPEIPEESDPEPDSVQATSEERESVFSESTKELQDSHEAPKNHPHVNSQRSHPQGDQSSLEPLEEMLRENLNASASENNTASNSSQLSGEQKTDAYKLLKKEMTVDLKTKFGSTADVLVSDDETTRLVTSLEDDFDEELDAEYYVVGKDEEEEDEEDFDELPLLTFTDGEDLRMPVESEVEKYSTDKEQNSSEEDEGEVTQPLGIKKGDKSMLTSLEDTVFSAVTEGEEQTGMDFESSDSEEEEEGEDGLIPDSKWGKPQSAADDNDPEKAEDVVPKTNNDKNPVMDTELHIKGKGRTVEESNRDLVEGKKGLEDGKKEDRTLPGSMQSSNLNSLPATEKGREILKSAFYNKENDLKGAAVHISKGMAHEEKPGEQISEGGSVNVWKHRAAGNEMKEEKIKQEAMDDTRLLGDNEHNASRDSVEKGIDVSGNGPEQHMPKAEHPSEEFKEEQLLKTQNQPRFSSPDEIGSSAELEDEGSILGRNLSGQPGGDVAAAVNTDVKGKTRLNEEEVTGDTFSEELVYPQPGTPEAATAGQTDSAEVPGFHPEQPEAEEEDPSAEELLEDENAVSAKQSKEKGLEMQDKQLDVNPQVSGSGIFDAINTNVETEESKENTSNILETESKNETEGRGVGTLGKEPGGPEVETEESPPAGKKAQGPSEGSGFPDKRKYQTPELGEVLRSQDPGYLKEDDPEEHAKTSGLAVKPGVELSKAGQEDTEKFMDTQSQGAAAEAREGDVPGAAHTTAKPEHSAHREDLPIISSFFKEQQSLQRFQKYFDVHELEAMLQEMSRKLKSAQRDSLPYNVEKVLDKVFRASESQILNVAEKMLDALVTEWRDSGMKERDILEEAAVLDDVQDLIYFVRYTHSTGEENGPLATTQPPEGGWGGPAEEIQPPLEDNFPQENIEDLKMQIPEEPGHSDQPVTSHVGVLEVPQKPNTEKDEHPGIFVTESTPDYFVDGKEQLEIHAEEPASATPVMVYLTKTLLSTLPGDVQPGPDFYGLPWKPVLITAFLGILSFVIFFWRTILAVRSHVYQVTEQQISEKLKMLKKENADLVQKLSNYEQKVKESKKHVQETKKQNMILSDEATKFKHRIKELEETKENLNDTAKNLRLLLESEREQNAKNEDLISENKISLEKLKDVIAMNASELSEVQIALNEAKLSEEKVKSECHRVQEENAKLKKKRDQLQQEIKDLNKSHAELSEQIQSFEKSQKDLEVTLTQKDDNINALTNCITQLNRLDCESESEHQHKTGNESDELANGEVGGDRSEKMKNQIKQMMDISRTQTEISVVEEDLKLLQCKLRASMSTKCNLEDQIKKLEDERSSLQAAKAGLEEENKTLKQKVEILNELYQQKEMTLQKKLSQEEFERREREQRLSAADEKAVSAAEEIKTYKWRIEELEDELQKTERSFKDQISANEKKAHENWLKARAAERAMAEEKREAANLRHKLLELTQKMAMLQEPVIVKPMPGRPSAQNPPRRGPLSQNGSFGPSPVSGGECSPPPRDPPARPLSATLSRRDVPRSEFGSVDEPPPPLQCSEAPGSPSASDPGSGAAPMMNSSPRSASPSRVGEGKVNMAAEGPAPFPGVPLMGGPLPPPIRYGPPPQLCRPFGPRPFPPPFGPGFRPPLGLREYPPGVPPGKRDVPFDPRGFVPGHPHFRPGGSPGPREYFAPGPRLPPPSHGPPEYPSPAARDSHPPGSREEPPPASQSGSQGPSQTLKQSP
ncbi:transport and Golgi organization protein 1 homolog isoform X3 [Myotis myotis]|uniref:Transport and Golgi organization protein 1 homolog n=2 Tax=Myotis myotis TaxID=51298 RepID=A0A7J7RUW8_MYOMY|nr:transport and Golgi organization protein 1 homolog isoform X3 [Myotis myotis]KAF6279940.1 MIA SH3 domain ER export factor 3 [Myotis myotis]